ncbi:MAG: TfoX/Sxy family protein [Alphaproteobacteria bacterium]|nr:TfoX/Sxy family protein [Alphaproteobacteria bacterium]
MGPVESRIIFGRHGIYLDDVMFAWTLTDGVLWLKADDLNRELYLDGGARAFTYKRQGKAIAMSYHSVPDVIWTDRAELISWAESAFAAAKRNKQKQR